VYPAMGFEDEVPLMLLVLEEDVPLVFEEEEVPLEDMMLGVFLALIV
jgi:hypothetical protein